MTTVHTPHDWIGWLLLALFLLFWTCLCGAWLFKPWRRPSPPERRDPYVDPEALRRAGAKSVPMQEAPAVPLVEAINELRDTEGDAVTLLCDNPDFGGPNNAVECCGGWTNYTNERFEGDTLLDALQKAVMVRRARYATPKPTPPPAPRPDRDDLPPQPWRRNA